MPLIDLGVNIRANNCIVFGEYAKPEKDRDTYHKYTYAEPLRAINLFSNPPEEKKEETAKPKIKITKTNKQMELSKKSGIRIKNIVNLLMECSIRKKVYSMQEKKTFSFKCSLMTLTIPQDCKFSDKKIHYKIFKPFIRILQEKHNLAEYIWKAEAQENGSIHYHVTINVFIHHRLIKKIWNEMLMNNKYVFKSENHENATTEIHSVKNIKNLGAYLCKYLSKTDRWKKETPNFIKEKDEALKKEKRIDEEFEREKEKYLKRKIEIKLWDCSINLKKKKCTIRFAQTDHPNIFNDIMQITERELQADFFSVWFYNRNEMLKTKYLSRLWREYISSVRMKKKQKANYNIFSWKEFEKKEEIIMN